ncbi:MULTISPECIES: ABC-2 transporter permease [unclassified Lysinibacillus]|uniref:ABC-2 transporter permease n=1 Tax=unclassified Lysinibacillus TaxID=2636778 RepID=UPI00131F3088|nr:MULTISPECIES: ABC-2 transporter permease [unclassified Lysinibacillus]
MLKLIHLEIKKHKLFNYWLGVLIANISIIALMSMIFIIEKIELNMPFEDFNMMMSMSDTLIRATFLIFSSIIMVKIIIEEYKSNLMSIMFTYPISRKKILLSKLTIVVIFTFTTIMFSSLLMGVGVYLLNPMIHIVPESISGENVVAFLTTSFFGALATAGLSLIPLFFGMRKKSSTATIVSAILLATLTGSSIDGVSMLQLISMLISLGIIGIIIGYLAVRNIEHVDI